MDTTCQYKTYSFDSNIKNKQIESINIAEAIEDDEQESVYECCTITIGSILTNSEEEVFIPKNWSKINFKISTDGSNCYFSLDQSEHVHYEFLLFQDRCFMIDLLDSKIFNYLITIQHLDLIVSLYINTATIESRTSLRDRCMLSTLMAKIFEINDESIDDEEILPAHDVNLSELFDKVITTRRSQSLKLPPDSDDAARCLELRTRLKKKLYLYQEQAILWMVQRELKKSSLQAPSLYQPVSLKNNVAFYNPHRNHLKVQLESIPALRSGGLLCDEMGLGKTVEVLGCVVLHKRNKPLRTGRRVLVSDSSSDEDDTNDNTPLAIRANALRLRPVFTRPTRARVPSNNKQREELEIVTTKPSRIPNEFIRKPSKVPSTTRYLLQNWYEAKLSCLSESVRKAKIALRATAHEQISCSCGISVQETNTAQLVQCCDCGIFQHAACFGYKIAKKPADRYLCPGCWKKQPLLKSGATLIVCPNRLINQWKDEIRKHVRGELNVLVYEGGSRVYPVYPTDLQRYDIVLTTYNVLQKDLCLTHSGGKSLRQKARYCPPAAPITNINWWRLVLDEAQIVETPSLPVSQMAKLLSVKHRWAVTGTPVSNGLDDLLGIFQYLLMKPYFNQDIWYFKLMRPYLTGNEEPMLNFLAEVMWRTEKRHIENQIYIPAQTVEVTWLDFNQIESYFYYREYEASKLLFVEKLNALNMAEQTPLNKLTTKELSNILAPVLTLRHACTHFSAVKGRYLVSRKPLNSLQDLLEALQHKNSVDFEDNIRVAVSAWNGMAGIHLLLNSPIEAVEQYKKVLRLKDTLRESDDSIKVEIDNLQVIHALYNLITIFEEHPHLREESQNIDQLNEAHLLHEKLYIAKFDMEVVKAITDFKEIKNSTCVSFERDNYNEIWDCRSIIDWIVNNHMYKRLLKMLENHPLMTDDRGFDQLNIVHNAGLIYKLDTWINDLITVRNAAFAAIEKLVICDTDDDVRFDNSTVEGAVQCHLRRSPAATSKRPKCAVCHADKKLNRLESLLYNKQWKRSSTAAKSRGNWSPSFEEIAFQCILRLGLRQPDNAENKRKAHLQKLLLDVMKKELKLARVLWMKISYSINSRDELNNCRVRLGLNPDNVVNESNRRLNNILRNLIGETDDRFATIHLLNRHQLDHQYALLNSEATLAMRQYERLLGTNLYLETLRGKDANAGGTGRGLDPCPICHGDLGTTFHMMPCGHCYCPNCMQVFAQESIRNRVACAVCRLQHNLKDINYLKMTKDETNAADAPIQGNCSTKLEAVIRLVLRLRKEEPAVKMLIYSIWDTVLEILQAALQGNGVQSVRMRNQNHLDQFKDPLKQITVLLLRISDGSKGLTLIDATHVVFLDPVLDPADELQAISRIHRIGQKRRTVVHKFLMKDSIDENIFNVTVKNAAQAIGWKDITIGQLKELYSHTAEM